MKYEPVDTGRLIVREFSLSDRDALLHFVRVPDQLKFMMFSLKDEAEVDSFLSMAVTHTAESGRREFHLAVDRKTHNGNEFIGSVALMGSKENPAEAELGYYFYQSAWGQGYACEASAAVLEYGFSVLGLHRVWGKCHTRNTGSARVMEKLGMKGEGTMREHVWMGDHWRSSSLFGILEDEWNAGKASRMSLSPH
jgi:ribosomal-protein-alanine N-acetyltransferase